jgi:hypothetical protein
VFRKDLMAQQANVGSRAVLRGRSVCRRRELARAPRAAPQPTSARVQGDIKKVRKVSP